MKGCGNLKNNKIYDNLISLKQKYEKQKGVFSINPIPAAQKEVCDVAPEIFENSKIFFKMQPRPAPFAFSREYEYHKYCLSKVQLEGLWVEFGSYKGVSARYLTKIKEEMFPEIKTPFYGFDSFEGLPEDWEGTNTKKGGLSAKESVPNIPGAEFNKGWFKDTIPKFLEKHSGPFSFLHVDSDIYSSAVDVFTLAEERIIPGTVILFDEIIGYDAWKLHEYKAFNEFVERHNVKYRWLAAVANAGQAACILEDRD